ncbi:MULTISPECIES: acyl-CoA thioesterase [unclassified Janibacter]|uniref:acyl-CoA thioesterase n=1 Tax=unclassified Janibacter TaxID=2649294 RepID=UPI003CFD5999
MDGKRFETFVPLRWSDMDAYQHVNNVQYLRLIEEARIAAFNDWFGFSDGDLERGVIVARSEIEYLAPLHYRTAPVQIDVWITKMSGASYDVAYEVRDPEGVGDGSLYALAETTMVGFDFETQRPRRLDEQDRATLSAYAGDPAPFRRRQG